MIVTAGTHAALAIQRATTTDPLVLIAVGDPVGIGLIASISRPGGNITGSTAIAAGLEGKRLERLREVVPKLSHLFVLGNPASPFRVVAEEEVRAAARGLQLKVLSLGVRGAEELDAAFEAIVTAQPGTRVVLADRLFLHNRARIVPFATRHRLPGVHAYRELAEAGGLVSFGPSDVDMHRRAATHVDKFLTGARAADLPVEQPAKFELVQNSGPRRPSAARFRLRCVHRGEPALGGTAPQALIPGVPDLAVEIPAPNDDSS